MHRFFEHGALNVEAMTLRVAQDVRKIADAVQSKAASNRSVSGKIAHWLILAASKVLLTIVQVRHRIGYRARLKERFIRMSLYRQAKQADSLSAVPEAAIASIVADDKDKRASVERRVVFLSERHGSDRQAEQRDAA